VPCHPEVRAVQITPIAPHAPRLSPVLLPHGVRVEIEALSTDRRPVRAVADGIDLGPVARLRVAPAEDDVKLAFFDGHTFTRTMLRKVLRS
jgi:NAD kinase